mmetsp:Transcript_20442/g.40890  ORF Transcript_20442/g.40890 Transcript_20442/m.40890 type:complete len:80 (-) Transcript_20442:523-762(-)
MQGPFCTRTGGSICTSSWAKLYLCLLGIIPWERHHPVPPESRLLPDWAPFYLERMWCHARMVYLHVGYLYRSLCVYATR